MAGRKKPLVVITRKLPDAIETRMRELFDARLNIDDHPMSRDELAAAMREADVLVPTITDRIDDKLIALANANARAAGVSDRVQFYNRDLFATDLSQATVVTIYLLTRSVITLQSRLFALKPGTRIVSHAGSMGEWKPDKTVEVKDPESSYSRTVHFWIVPAQVEGTHEVLLKTPDGEQKASLTLKQQFQEVTGTAKVGDKEVPITDGKLRGNELSFSADAQKYSATIQPKDDAERKKAA